MLGQGRAELRQDELEKIVDAKFTCIAALQRYSVMRADELADVEVLLHELQQVWLVGGECREAGLQRRWIGASGSDQLSSDRSRSSFGPAGGQACDPKVLGHAG